MVKRLPIETALRVKEIAVEPRSAYSGHVRLMCGEESHAPTSPPGMVENCGSTSILHSITYDPFGPITSWSWGNSTAASRAFDTDGKVTQVDNAAGLSLKNYAYDDAFRITGISDAGDSALSWTYGYDALDRRKRLTNRVLPVQPRLCS